MGADARVEDAGLPVCVETQLPDTFDQQISYVVWAGEHFLVMGSWPTYEPPYNPIALHAVSATGEVLWTREVDGLQQIWAAGDTAWALTRGDRTVDINQIDANGGLTSVTTIDLPERPRQGADYAVVRPDGRAGWIVGQPAGLWRFDEDGVRAVDLPEGLRAGVVGVQGADERLFIMLSSGSGWMPPDLTLGAVTTEGVWSLQPIDMAYSWPLGLIHRDGRLRLGLSQYANGLGQPYSGGDFAEAVWLLDFDPATLNMRPALELEVDGALQALAPEGAGWVAVAGSRRVEISTLDADGALLSRDAFGGHEVRLASAAARAPDGAWLVGAYEYTYNRGNQRYLLSVPTDGCVSAEHLPHLEPSAAAR